MRNGLIIALLLALPEATFAATYMYVDDTGHVRYIDAASADMAFMLAPDIARTSGVARMDGNDSEVRGTPAMSTEAGNAAEPFALAATSTLPMTSLSTWTIPLPSLEPVAPEPGSFVRGVLDWNGLMPGDLWRTRLPWR